MQSDAGLTETAERGSTRSLVLLWLEMKRWMGVALFVDDIKMWSVDEIAAEAR
jgi:hypothetical protein